MTGVTIFVHWLHILAAALWFGVSMAAMFVTLPALLKRPPTEARAAYQAVVARMWRLLPVVGQLTFWMGLLRGTWLGPVNSMAVLLGTPYGHTFLTALLLTIATIVHGATTGARIEQRVWDGNQFRPDGAAYVRRHGLITFVLFALILACMVTMRFGV